MAILVPASVLFNRHRLNNSPLPEVIAGTWTGQVEIFTDFKKGKSPSPYSEDWIKIEITIDKTGHAIGYIGDAELAECQVKLNRNWFERYLNIKTDFYIQEATLNDQISPLDTVHLRKISIPFNIIDGQFRGSIFQVEGWQYPDPLFPYLTLQREEEHQDLQ
jgi:hypothetical protein